ncbi:unnamed protein product, partial [Cuscuta epithymum]
MTIFNMLKHKCLPKAVIVLPFPSGKRLSSWVICRLYAANRWMSPSVKSNKSMHIQVSSPHDRAMKYIALGRKMSIYSFKLLTHTNTFLNYINHLSLFLFEILVSACITTRILTFCDKLFATDIENGRNMCTDSDCILFGLGSIKVVP